MPSVLSGGVIWEMSSVLYWLTITLSEGEWRPCAGRRRLEAVKIEFEPGVLETVRVIDVSTVVGDHVAAVGTLPLKDASRVVQSVS